MSLSILNLRGLNALGGSSMAFLITKCRECGTDCAVFDDGSHIQCKCGLSPNFNPFKKEFKRPQLIEDEANE